MNWLATHAISSTSYYRHHYKIVAFPNLDVEISCQIAPLGSPSLCIYLQHFRVLETRCKEQVLDRIDTVPGQLSQRYKQNLIFKCLAQVVLNLQSHFIKYWNLSAQFSRLGYFSKITYCKLPLRALSFLHYTQCYIFN